MSIAAMMSCIAYAGDNTARFQGLWASAGAACDKVFTTRGGEAAFIEYSGEKAPGLIIKGNRIQGANATCSLVSSTDKPDSIVAVLKCRQQIIFDTMVVHLRFKGDDEMIRFDPDVPELATAFHRCRM
jgi:hypothetical protein